VAEQLRETTDVMHHPVMFQAHDPWTNTWFSPHMTFHKSL